MRYPKVAVSILAGMLAVFGIAAAAQRSQQNSQDQNAPNQPSPAPSTGSYGWYGGCGSGMGYGMMGPGMMGYGMMGPGMMGPGMMGMMGWGSRWQQGNLNLSKTDVKGYLERWIAMSGDPRLKIGPITEKDSNTIAADVVTGDKDSLVQRFTVDRRTGVWQPGMMGWSNGTQQGNLNLSASDVKGYLERWTATTGNPRIKVGPVTEKDSNTITADVVTVQNDTLIQRYSVDRHTGVWQPVQ